MDSEEAEEILQRNEQFGSEDWEKFEAVTEFHQEYLKTIDNDQKRLTVKNLMFRSGWWSRDNDVAFEPSGENIMNLEKLVQTLVLKTMEWFGKPDQMFEFSELIRNEGIFVFSHKKSQCFTFASQSCSIIDTCQGYLSNAFFGHGPISPIQTLLLITNASDWDFYFVTYDKDIDLDQKENETILKHNSLWPFGANTHLNFTLKTLTEIRTDCLKQAWPRVEGVQNIEEKSQDSVEMPMDFKKIGFTEFKRVIVDLNDKELKTYCLEFQKLHSLAKRLKTRYNSFEDEDFENMDSFYELYKEFLMQRSAQDVTAMKRDMRYFSGWWGLDLKAAVHEYNDRVMNLICMRDTLLQKTMEWQSIPKNDAGVVDEETLALKEEILKESIQNAGVFCLQHRSIPHFRYVSQSENVLDTVRCLINDAIIGQSEISQLSTLILCTSADDWYFYFKPIDNQWTRDTVENDTTIKHDSLWPNGLNNKLLQNHRTLADIHRSCAKYGWPRKSREKDIYPLPQN